MANVRFSTQITLGGVAVMLPPKQLTRAKGLANSVFCPLGPAPTEAYVCLLRSELDKLDKNAPHTLTWMQTQIVDVEEDEDPVDPVVTTLNFKGFYIRQARRLMQGGLNDENSLFLVHLSDVRYLIAKNSATGPIRANPRSYANANAFLQGSNLSSYNTWENLVSALWSDCALLGSYPGLPPSLPIDGVPQNTFLIGLNALAALSQVLDQLDCALQHDPFADTYSIVQLGEAQTIPANSDTLRYDAELVSTSASIAATVRVHFFYHRKGYGQERDTELVNNWVVIGASDVIDKSTEVEGAVGMRFLWDDLPLVIEEDGSFSNTSEADTRANNRKDRYVARYSVEQKHRIHEGLSTDYMPGGKIRACLWRSLGDGEENILGGTVTEFVAGSDLVCGYKNGRDTEHPSKFYTVITSELEAYSPPDWGRHSHPNYPRLPNIVQVKTTDSFKEPGETVQPTSGVHPGVVKKWIDGSMQDMDPCWILFVDSFDSKQGAIEAIEGEYYGPARLSGIYSVGLDTRPIYLVNKGSANDIVIFELKEEMLLGVGDRTAEAYICELVGGVYVSTDTVITVCDSDPPGNPAIGTISFGKWAGKEGFHGIAKRRADGKYDIIDMERLALIVEFTCSVDRDPDEDSFEASIDTAFQHGARMPETHESGSEGDSGERITIYDDQKRFPRVLKGGTGLAIWNDRAGEYICIMAQQQCILAIAKINSAAGGLKETDTTATITEFEALSPSPFNLVPAEKPTSANNNIGFRGKDDDPVILVWDEGQEEWKIIQISHNEIGGIVKPTADAAKGTTPVLCQVFRAGAFVAEFVNCIPLGDAVVKNKICSTYVDPQDGKRYVAPWEP